MQIDSISNDAAPPPPPRRRRTVRNILLAVVAAVVVISAGGFALTTGVTLDDIKAYFNDRGYRALDNRQGVASALVSAVPRIVNGYFTTPDLPTVRLDIKFKHIKTLRDKRAEALRLGQLITEANDLVPATMTVGGKTVRVKVRLKGDWIDHLRGEKWSFRVKVRDGEEALGMRRFSLQHPRARGFHGETLYVATLRKFDIVAPRYSFVNLTVNGQDLGVMAVEEHFSKELLEHSGRKEGVIVKFDESTYWASLPCDTAGGCFDRALHTPFDSFRNTSIGAFRETKVAASPKLSSDYRVAVGMLRAFSRGDALASEIFDVDRLGAFIAIAEIWGSWHTVRWHNLRYYLNPYTMKLEPIGFDGNVHKPNTNGIFRQPIVVQMLRDSKVYAAYRKTFDTLAASIASGELIQELKQVENRYLPALRNEFYFLGTYDYKQLKIRARTAITSHKYPILAHAYIIDNGDGAPYLELVNATEKDVHIESIEWVGDNGTFEFEAATDVALPIELPALTAPSSVPGLESASQPLVVRIPFRKAATDPPPRLQITASIPGTAVTVVADARPYFPDIARPPLPRSELREALAQHPFLHESGADHVLAIKPGTWRVTGNLVIPKGYTLEIPAGTTLRFAPTGVLVVNGPVRFAGTAEAPIVLEGDAEVWQGVAVMEAGGQSEWSYVTVRNTTGVSQGAWQLTGGVVFYKSNVRLTGATFDGNRGEDALNIIESAFEMDGVTISNTASDGFDGDYVTGTVRNSEFRDIGKLGGGDAVDVSGSTITIEDSQFERVSDKALSVGEGSTMHAANLVMNDVAAGAASKDRSHLDLTDSSITGAYVAALMAYIKKPEYGGAEIVANRVTITGSASEVVVQEGSRITLNGAGVAAGPVDVDELYKTVMKAGAKS